MHTSFSVKTQAPYLTDWQENMLRSLLVCCQWIPLTPVDEVKGHGCLLLDERLLLLVRLEEERDASVVKWRITVNGQFDLILSLYNHTVYWTTGLLSTKDHLHCT